MKETAKAYRRGWNKGYRLAIITVLGRLCRRCGETDLRLLTIDHKYGGGTQHRKRTNHGTSYYISIALEIGEKGGLSKYRCLCHNCQHLTRKQTKRGMP